MHITTLGLLTFYFVFSVNFKIKMASDIFLQVKLELLLTDSFSLSLNNTLALAHPTSSIC